MNLFRKKSQPPTEPSAPAPSTDSLILAEQELDSATHECLALDEERRAWGLRRENANTRFGRALANYHLERDRAEKTA